MAHLCRHAGFLQGAAPNREEGRERQERFCRQDPPSSNDLRRTRRDYKQSNLLPNLPTFRAHFTRPLHPPPSDLTLASPPPHSLHSLPTSSASSANPNQDISVLLIDPAPTPQENMSTENNHKRPATEQVGEESKKPCPDTYEVSGSGAITVFG